MMDRPAHGQLHACPDHTRVCARCRRRVPLPWGGACILKHVAPKRSAAFKQSHNKPTQTNKQTTRPSPRPTLEPFAFLSAMRRHGMAWHGMAWPPATSDAKVHKQARQELGRAIGRQGHRRRVWCRQRGNARRFALTSPSVRARAGE
jgi:hypothetical protein